MSELIKVESTRDPKHLDIRWLPNNVCNFKCRYCFPDSNTGTCRSPQDLDLIVNNFDHLINSYKEKLGKEKVNLYIAGGEPTLWKDLDRFIHSIKEKQDVYISLITNGSRTLRWWKDHGHNIDNVHLTHHVKQANLDHTIAVADILYNHGKKTTVKVLMDSTCWDECVSAVEYLKKNSKTKFFIQVAEVIEQDNLQHYTKEQKSYMKWGIKRIPPLTWFWKNRHFFKDGEIRYTESVGTFDNGKKIRAGSGTYLNKNLNTFKGWDCNIGLDSVFINFDGSIQGACGEKVYGLDYTYNILDTDFSKKFNIELKPTKCSQCICACSPETHLTKFKPAQ